MLFARVAVLIVLAVTVAATMDGRAPASSAVASAMIDLANAERARAGLAPFRANGRLARATQIQAEQVARRRRLEHTVSGARYPTLRDRLDAVDYEWQAMGENLTFGQRSAAQATATWMRAAGHRANILNPRFTEMGAAQFRDRSDRPYYVQVFARPAP